VIAPQRALPGARARARRARAHRRAAASDAAVLRASGSPRGARAALRACACSCSSASPCSMCAMGAAMRAAWASCCCARSRGA